MAGIKFGMAMGLVGCKKTEDFDWDDLDLKPTACDKEIEEALRQWVFDNLDTWFERIAEGESV